MSNALNKALSSSHGEDDDAFEYIIVLSRQFGGMQYTYLMIDPATNTIAPKVCRVKWPRLIDTGDYRACVLKNVLYVSGGRELSTGKYLKQVLRYEPYSARWRECASMKKARACHTMVSLDGKIYVMGGATSDKAVTDTVESYEPFMDEWRREEPLPAPRKNHACTQREDTIYLSGGASNTEMATNNMWMLDKIWVKAEKNKPLVEVEMWTDVRENGFLENLTAPLSSHSVIKRKDHMLVVGGMTLQERLDPNDDDGIRMMNFLGASSAIEAYRFPRKQVVLKEESTVMETPKTKFRKKKKEEEVVPEPPRRRKAWIQNLPNMPEPRCGCDSVVLGNKIYVIGGHDANTDDQSSHNSVIYYHTKKETWTTAFPLDEGNYRDVQCVTLRIPRTNRDFRPVRFSDCKWVMW